MVDSRFYLKSKPHSLLYISRHIGANIARPIFHSDIHPENIMIDEISSIDRCTASSLSFLNNIKYSKCLLDHNITSCIVSEDFPQSQAHEKIWLLRSPNPYYSYSQALRLFYSHKTSGQLPANIHPSARIGKHAVIEDDVTIGENTSIGHGSVIGLGVQIGDNVSIGHNVTITHSIVGNNVTIMSGARIGQDGFGFATHNKKHHQIFHIGRVIIGNDVEIGANTTIDRGSLQDTVIEDDVRIDNLVQIGHNVLIGQGSIIVAQVGIAGSSKIGKYCVLGGQVGIAGHISIASNVQIAGKSGIIQNVDEEGIALGGTPAIPLRDWHKQSIMLRNMVKKG